MIIVFYHQYYNCCGGIHYRYCKHYGPCHYYNLKVSLRREFIIIISITFVVLYIDSTVIVILINKS